MCGIVGVMGDIQVKEERAFKELLVIDAIRGYHSTGVIAVDRTGSVETFKKALVPSELVELRGYENLLRLPQKLLIGHNRWATKGAVNSKNAHPFTHGDITGVHNGTLKQAHKLPDNTKFAVDSESLIHSLDKIGIDETFAVLEGAWALVWHNSQDNTVNIIRNKERPLFACYSEDSTTLWWASEGWMLRGILDRNGIKYKDVTMLDEDKLYTIPMPGFGVKEEIAGCTIREVKGFIPPPAKKFGGQYKKAGKGGGQNHWPKTLHTKLARVAITEKSHYNFFVDRVHCTKSTEPMSYRLDCTLAMDSGQQVTSYISGHHAMLEQFNNPNSEFRGMVSSVYETRVKGKPAELSIVILANSILMTHEGDEEEERKADDDSVIIVGPTGEATTGKKFLADTHRGCEWCQKHPSIEESADLMWFDPKTFVCLGCSSDATVQDYFNQENREEIEV